MLEGLFKGDAQFSVVVSVRDRYETTWGDCVILEEQISDFSLKEKDMLEGWGMMRFLYK